jgi:hypothetical protein
MKFNESGTTTLDEKFSDFFDLSNKFDRMVN